MIHIKIWITNSGKGKIFLVFEKIYSKMWFAVHCGFDQASLCFAATALLSDELCIGPSKWLQQHVVCSGLWLQLSPPSPLYYFLLMIYPYCIPICVHFSNQIWVHSIKKLELVAARKNPQFCQIMHAFFHFLFQLDYFPFKVSSLSLCVKVQSANFSAKFPLLPKT